MQKNIQHRLVIVNNTITTHAHYSIILILFVDLQHQRNNIIIISRFFYGMSHFKGGVTLVRLLESLSLKRKFVKNKMRNTKHTFIRLVHCTHSFLLKLTYSRCKRIIRCWVIIVCNM